MATEMRKRLTLSLANDAGSLVAFKTAGLLGERASSLSDRGHSRGRQGGGPGSRSTRPGRTVNIQLTALFRNQTSERSVGQVIDVPSIWVDCRVETRSRVSGGGYKHC
jgi:hypothetical protein